MPLTHWQLPSAIYIQPPRWHGTRQRLIRSQFFSDWWGSISLIRVSFSKLCSFLALFLLIGTSLSMMSQNSLDPGTPNAQVPVVTFEQEWKVADPQWYQISISSSGEGSYKSQP